MLKKNTKLLCTHGPAAAASNKYSIPNLATLNKAKEDKLQMAQNKSTKYDLIRNSLINVVFTQSYQITTKPKR